MLSWYHNIRSPALPTPVSASYHGASTIRLAEPTSADNRVQAAFCNQPWASPITAIQSCSFLPSFHRCCCCCCCPGTRRTTRKFLGPYQVESLACAWRCLPTCLPVWGYSPFLLSPTSLANTEASECFVVPGTNTPMLPFLHGHPAIRNISEAQQRDRRLRSSRNKSRQVRRRELP